MTLLCVFGLIFYHSPDSESTVEMYKKEMDSGISIPLLRETHQCCWHIDAEPIQLRGLFQCSGVWHYEC